jgi:hypothetical protein
MPDKLGKQILYSIDAPENPERHIVTEFSSVPGTVPELRTAI